MNKTIKAPATVRELGDMAEALGITATDLLELLGPIPMPPAGYTLAHGSQNRWIGADIVKQRWIIQPVWDGSTNRHSLELWMADHRAPNYAELTPAAALQLALDLEAAARALGATE